MAIISRESDYAVRALASLAKTDEWLSVSAMAEQEDIPEVFLRKIMQRLNRAGVVESRRGPFGGYRLAMPAEQVTVLDAVEIVQGPLVINECFADPDICPRVDFCPLRRRLSEIQVELNAKLAELNLAAVLDDTRAREASSR
ncbi:MAG: Rrf2 family transcriptional regulator [Candidatus Brocadiaceae bacterium]|jgi:Rrf2 family protein